MLQEPYPWQCPHCLDWTDDEYTYYGGCPSCHDSQIRWRWLAWLDAEWRSWRLGMHFKTRKLRKWLWMDCYACHKPWIVFGRYVGDHSHCIPF